MSACDDLGPSSPEDGESAGPTTDATPEGTDLDTNTLGVDLTADDRQQPFDVLAAQRRRREHAVRSEGGDPEYPGDLRFHVPSTGLRASGFRSGFACGGTDALRRVWNYIPAEHRADVARIAAEYQDNE